MGAAFCPSVYSQDKDDTGAIPSNSQAWEKLALILIFICVCEYLLHVAAQRLDGGGGRHHIEGTNRNIITFLVVCKLGSLFMQLQRLL